MGYDSLRANRFRSLKRAGIIPEESKLPPPLATIRPWTTLTGDERKVESRKMELYAAMVDNLDFHVGRLIQFLKDEGLYDNTLIVFMSDNGAAGEDFYVTPPYSTFIAPRYDNRYENMGRRHHLFRMVRSGRKLARRHTATTKVIPRKEALLRR